MSMVQYYATELVREIETINEDAGPRSQHQLMNIIRELGGQEHLARDMPMPVATLYALALLLRQY